MESHSEMPNDEAHLPPKAGATKRGTNEGAQAVGSRMQRLVRPLLSGVCQRTLPCRCLANPSLPLVIHGLLERLEIHTGFGIKHQ